MPFAGETVLLAPLQTNSVSAATARLAQGRISWTGPLLLLLARTTLWMTAQSLVALLFVLQHRPDP